MHFHVYPAKDLDALCQSGALCQQKTLPKTFYYSNISLEQVNWEGGISEGGYPNPVHTMPNLLIY